MSTTYTPQQLVDRCLLVRKAQNIVGSALHLDMLARFNEIYEKYWSTSDDVCLGLNNGYYNGAEAVKGYYAQKAKNAAAVTEFNMRKWPEKFDGLTATEAYGAGYVKGNDFHTPIIEIAEDMQSAKCLFQVQSSNTNITVKGPISYWNLSVLAVDLIMEGDEFKIKNMLWVNDIDHPVAEPWTEPTKYPDLDEFSALKALKEPEPNVKKAVFEAYHPNREYPQYPMMPEPYVSLSETFSYGMQERSTDYV